MEYLQVKTPFIEKWEKEMEDMLTTGEFKTEAINVSSWWDKEFQDELGQQFELSFGDLIKHVTKSAVHKEPVHGLPNKAPILDPATKILKDIHLSALPALFSPIPAVNHHPGKEAVLLKDVTIPTSVDKEVVKPAQQTSLLYSLPLMPPTIAASSTLPQQKTFQEEVKKPSSKKRKAAEVIPEESGEDMRKELHNATEKRRREKINVKINELRDIIPACKEHGTNKASILQHAVEYVKTLDKTHNELITSNAQLKQKNEQLQHELRELHRTLWARSREGYNPEHQQTQYSMPYNVPQHMGYPPQSAQAQPQFQYALMRGPSSYPPT